MKIRLNKNILSLIILLLTVSLGNYFLKGLNKKRLEKLGMEKVRVDDTKISIESIYTTIPSSKKCIKGILRDTEIQEFVETVNRIRILHNLRPITYRYKDEYRASEAALVRASNHDKNGKPNKNYRCWSNSTSESQQDTVQTSLIYVPTSVTTTNDQYLNKFVSTKELLEAAFNRKTFKRFVFLNPFVSELSFGRFDGLLQKQSIKKNGEEIRAYQISSMAIRIENYRPENLMSLEPNFIAYPYNEYPSELFLQNSEGYPALSFSVVADKISIKNSQKVDFSNVNIEILDENEKSVKVNAIDYSNDMPGLGNILSWKIDNLNTNTRYEVHIKNVKLIDKVKNYKYWFKLV